MNYTFLAEMPDGTAELHVFQHEGQRDELQLRYLWSRCCNRMTGSNSATPEEVGEYARQYWGCETLRVHEYA